MAEWKEYKLGETATFSQGIQVAPEEQKSYEFKGSVRFLRIVDFTKGNNEEIRFIDNPGSRYLVDESDLVMIRYGSQTAGKIAKGFKGAIANNTFKISLNESLLSKSFTFYFLSQKSIFEFFHFSQASSTMPAITFEMISNLSIPVPPLPEQRAIAAVLSSLDDKIDLLHRQNATLEAMAETLFKQWFVKDAQEKWEEKPLSGIANFLNGLACQKYPPKTEVYKLPVLKIKDLSDGLSDSSDWASSEIPPQYIIEAGDIIFAWSASLMVKIWNGEKCVLNQHLFKVTSDVYPKWFYYYWCKHHLEEFIAISESHATTMGHIKRGDLDAAMVLVPTVDELEQMSIPMETLLSKMIMNSKQTKLLEKLRDILLPKLMSGEVRVRY